jgi:hypothetical protein
MVGKGSQRGLGLPSLWLACELRAISVLIARFGVTCPYITSPPQRLWTP